MPTPAITKETVKFLKDLKKNNDREWFNAHKEKFLEAHQNFLEVTQTLINKVAAFDKSLKGVDAKDAVFRIYRDIRFSKDKSPFKTHFGANLKGKSVSCSNAGYYFHLEPGGSFLAGGIHMPEASCLKAIREDISDKGKDFLKIINDKKFKTHFTLHGEKLTKVPKGFEKDDPMAEYLKHKEFIAIYHLKDSEIISEDLVSDCASIFKSMMPLNEFLNDALPK
jgi:uncharacterized protein (TIGR02453 family)